MTTRKNNTKNAKAKKPATQPAETNAAAPAPLNNAAPVKAAVKAVAKNKAKFKEDKNKNRHYQEFRVETVDWNGQKIEKILGPGMNPDEVKFEGDINGPFYVHSRHGSPVEVVKDHADPQDGYYVRFGGSEEDCHGFCRR